MIKLEKCNGCGLCVPACPNGVLAIWDGKAIVANPLACEYTGQCETACPIQAIARLFYIVPQIK